MHRSLLLAPLMALLCLVGCSDGGSPEPRIAPSDTSSATSTPTSPEPSTPAPTGPVEPTMPAAAEGTDAAAAEAFVRFYWEMVNYAQATGDVEGLRRITGRGCDNCAAATDAIEKIYASGGRLIGGDNSVTTLSSERLRAANVNLFRVSFTLSNTRQRVEMPEAADDRINEASTLRGSMTVTPAEGWRVDIFEVG